MGKCLGMCLVGFEVWPWHEVRGRMLWEREKMVLSPSTFGFKKKLIPNWTSLVSEMSVTTPRNFPGRFPPTSEPKVRESQRSGSASPLFPTPSVKQWTGSEAGPRLVQVRAQRVFDSAFSSIRLTGTASPDRWEITDLDQWVIRSCLCPHFPLLISRWLFLFFSHLQKWGSGHLCVNHSLANGLGVDWGSPQE